MIGVEIGAIRAMRITAMNEAIQNFGMLLDTARADPAEGERPRRGFTVLRAVDEHELEGNAA